MNLQEWSELELVKPDGRAAHAARRIGGALGMAAGWMLVALPGVLLVAFGWWLLAR